LIIYWMINVNNASGISEKDIDEKLKSSLVVLENKMEQNMINRLTQLESEMNTKIDMMEAMFEEKLSNEVASLQDDMEHKMTTVVESIATELEEKINDNVAKIESLVDVYIQNKSTSIKSDIEEKITHITLMRNETREKMNNIMTARSEIRDDMDNITTMCKNIITSFTSYIEENNLNVISARSEIEENKISIDKTSVDVRGLGRASIMLKEGPSPTKTRYEGNVYIGGRPVCDDAWDVDDAGVVCRMLGFSGGLPTMESTYGSVPNNYIMDNVGCTGAENTIFQCSHLTVDDCSSSEGAGVICGNIELKGGSEDFEGNVFIGDRPVCDDSWDDQDARVVCRMLGYPGGKHKVKSAYGSVPSTFILDDVVCTGNEETLWECPHQTTDDCGAGEGAGVICGVSCGGHYALSCGSCPPDRFEDVTDPNAANYCNGDCVWDPTRGCIGS